MTVLDKSFSVWIQFCLRRLTWVWPWVRNEQLVSYHGSLRPEAGTGPVFGCVFVHRLIATHASAEVGPAVFVVMLGVVFETAPTISYDLLLPVVARLYNPLMCVSGRSLLWLVASHLIFLVTMSCACSFSVLFRHQKLVQDEKSAKELLLDLLDKLGKKLPIELILLLVLA